MTSSYAWYETLSLKHCLRGNWVIANTRWSGFGKSMSCLFEIQIKKSVARENIFKCYLTKIASFVTFTNSQFFQQSLLIRILSIQNNGLFSGLSNVILQYSTYNVTNKIGLRQVRNVEYCTCPFQYTGQFCQHCNNGFTRSPVNGGPYDNCIPCQCNQHSDRCNPKNGTCYECKHFTEGKVLAAYQRGRKIKGKLMQI